MGIHGKILVDMMALPNKNNNTETIGRLEGAIKDGNADAVKIYLENGGDPDIKLSGTPLIKMALEKGTFKLPTYFLIKAQKWGIFGYHIGKMLS